MAILRFFIILTTDRYPNVLVVKRHIFLLSFFHSTKVVVDLARVCSRNVTFLKLSQHDKLTNTILQLFPSLTVTKIYLSSHDLVNWSQHKHRTFTLNNSMIYRVIIHYHATSQPSFITEALLLPDPFISTIGSA